MRVRDGSIDWRAMECLSRKAYHDEKSYWKGKKTAFREMSRGKISSFLKVVVANSAKKQLKSSGATIIATATVKVVPLQ